MLSSQHSRSAHFSLLSLSHLRCTCCREYGTDSCLLAVSHHQAVALSYLSFSSCPNHNLPDMKEFLCLCHLKLLCRNRSRRISVIVSDIPNPSVVVIVVVASEKLYHWAKMGLQNDGSSGSSGVVYCLYFVLAPRRIPFRALRGENFHSRLACVCWLDSVGQSMTVYIS